MNGGTGAPGKAAPQIRYALSQLPSKNGHHEFEHLCRAFARLHITPNVLPATGPVSAGGDQGRDFETFRSHVQERLPDSFLASDRGLRIVFACTLERGNLAAKIKNDLRAITEGGPVDQVYFFCEQDIVVARRHELCAWALENHGVDIEIIDGQALSELLAAEDCLWIAERYLGVEVPGRRSEAPSTTEPGSGLFGSSLGNGVQAGVIHGDVTIYHAEGRTVAQLAGTHRGSRSMARSDRSAKGQRRAAGCLIAVAAASAIGLVVVPGGRAGSPRAGSPRTTSARAAPSRTPAPVLDDVAGRQWSGPVFYDRTFTSGKETSVQLTVSFEPAPLRKQRATVGWLVYGTLCPRGQLVLIRDSPTALTLADTPPPLPWPLPCRGASFDDLYISELKPTIRITLARGNSQIEIYAWTMKTGTIYWGTLQASK